MSLPRFTLQGNLMEILSDGDTSSALPSGPLDLAVITARPNVSPKRLITWSDSLYRVWPVTGKVDANGDIVASDGVSPMLLVANDDGLSVRYLEWQIIITIPAQVVPSSPKYQFTQEWISAPGDGDVFSISGGVTTGTTVTDDGTGLFSIAIGGTNTFSDDGTGLFTISSGGTETLTDDGTGLFTVTVVNVPAIDDDGTGLFVVESGVTSVTDDGSGLFTVSAGEPALTDDGTGLYVIGV